MIQLPTTPPPASVTPNLIDWGLTLNPPTGAGATRVNRPGSRFELQVVFPPMRPDTARPFVTRLIQAKRQGLRMPYPLLGVTQGSPGTPIVSGVGAGGTFLPLRGLTVGYVILEGYWLTVIDSAGVYYLHTVAAGSTVNGAGHVDIVIEPPLRAPLVDGNTVLLQAPMVEGLIMSDVNWPLIPDRLVTLSFTLRENG